jgi:hypothetical protein
MKNRFLSLCGLMAMLATAGLSQTTRPGEPGTTSDASPIVGFWHADMDGLPAITLVVTKETGSLSGAVLFYFHRRDAVGQPWTSTPGLPEPLFNPQFDGKTLTFQVSHRRAHPPRTLNDPPVSFRLTLTGVNKADLINESESPSMNGNATSPGFPMARTDY